MVICGEFKTNLIIVVKLLKIFKCFDLCGEIFEFYCIFGEVFEFYCICGEFFANSSFCGEFFANSTFCGEFRNLYVEIIESQQTFRGEFGEIFQNLKIYQIKFKSSAKNHANLNFFLISHSLFITRELIRLKAHGNLR